MSTFLKQDKTTKTMSEFSVCMPFFFFYKQQADRQSFQKKTTKVCELIWKYRVALAKMQCVCIWFMKLAFISNAKMAHELDQNAHRVKRRFLAAISTPATTGT